MCFLKRAREKKVQINMRIRGVTNPIRRHWGELKERRRIYNLIRIIFALLLLSLPYIIHWVLICNYPNAIKAIKSFYYLKNISLHSFVGLYYCVLGIMISGAIYFTFKITKTRDLKDYLNMLCDIIKDAEPDNQLVIISPSFYIGSNRYKKESEEYLISIIEQLKLGVKIKWAFLNTSSHETSYNDYLKALEECSDSFFNAFPLNDLLVEYHNIFLAYQFYEKNKDTRKRLQDYYYELCKYRSQLWTYSDNYEEVLLNDKYKNTLVSNC